MSLWDASAFDEHEQLCFFTDKATSLRGIVSLHSTVLGPAVGGTRFWPYREEHDALEDVLRLSRGMSYKCAAAGVPFGGGKAVIIGDPAKLKSPALLQQYAACVNRLGGHFITGEDVGMTLQDCEALRKASPYIIGTGTAGAGDPSIHTAQGVAYGLGAVLKHGFNRDDFDNVRIAVQGLGHVGWRLCGLLHKAGARLTVSDLNAEVVRRAEEEFSATAVNSSTIYSSDVDIFAPCALGGAINPATVDIIKARAVAGAANNQLLSSEMGQRLHRRGILYAPDYVINSGGLIGAVDELNKVTGRSAPITGPVEARLKEIQGRLISIFVRSRRDNLPPESIADASVREILAQ